MSDPPKPTRRPPDDDEGSYVWINSEVMPDGTYAPSIAFTDDRSIALTEPAALGYALAVLDAAHRADYDAAVLRQMRGLDLDDDVAASMVAFDLRPARPSQRATGTPLSLNPGVSQRTGEGFLTVRLDGEPIGQWSVPAARGHALAILDALVVAPLDATYHQLLTGTLDLDDGRARAIVEDVAEHRADRAE